MVKNIDRYINYIKKQGINSVGISKSKINHILEKNIISIPNDFIEFYSRTNGMESLYPNYSDDNGFLIYPVEKITPAYLEFEDTMLLQKDNLYIFANYLNKCWWYGLKIDNLGYTIGMIPDSDTFNPITNSLDEFIELYIADSEKLYPG